MFEILFTDEALKIFDKIKKDSLESTSKKKLKSSVQAGLFKQLKKAIKFLSENPRHPGLQTHEYSDLSHPWNQKMKVFEAYIQNRTSSAYRLFWCYGPEKKQITVITHYSTPLTRPHTL